MVSSLFLDDNYYIIRIVLKIMPALLLSIGFFINSNTKMYSIIFFLCLIGDYTLTLKFDYALYIGMGVLLIAYLLLAVAAQIKLNYYCNYSFIGYIIMVVVLYTIMTHFIKSESNTIIFFIAISLYGVLVLGTLLFVAINSFDFFIKSDIKSLDNIYNMYITLTIGLLLLIISDVSILLKLLTGNDVIIFTMSTYYLGLIFVYTYFSFYTFFYLDLSSK